MGIISNHIGVPFWNRAHGSGGAEPLPPELKEALVGVWIADQNTNDSPTRNIIKNKIKDAGGDFEILNAAYKLNSGYGEYGEDFTRFRSPFGALATVKHDAYNIKGTISNGWLIYLPNNTKTNQTKVSISGIKDNYYLIYDYHQNDGNFRLEIKEDGVYDIPANDGLGDGRGSGFMLVGISGDTNIDITIKQIPSYLGAFVTDGVDDLIVSQKTTSEMLGGSNELTVISMIHQIKDYTSNLSYTNYIRNDNGYIRNNVTNIGKTGIYGYNYKSNATAIKSILGDKNDYNVEGNLLGIDSVFSVVGRSDALNLSQVAWYWTFISKRVLTTDEINQVIAYYNLDKYVAPDVYYDVNKQGITNDNHAEFGDKLIDYSGNGRDMQLHNFDWNENSGIGSGVYDGMLVTDGVKSFGKVEGVPIYKDYTVVSERALLEPPGNGNIGAFVSKAYASSQGAFILDEVSNSWSFGTATKVNVQSGIKTIYQTKYVYNGQSITAGEGVDSTNMWLATLRENDARFSKIAITILMVFQYSMCEFLMERQLKKRRLAKLSK